MPSFLNRADGSSGVEEGLWMAEKNSILFLMSELAVRGKSQKCWMA
jgi:hypothetical protein